jgi:hypothetical protein
MRQEYMEMSTMGQVKSYKVESYKNRGFLKMKDVNELMVNFEVDF